MKKKFLTAFLCSALCACTVPKQARADYVPLKDHTPHEPKVREDGQSLQEHIREIARAEKEREKLHNQLKAYMDQLIRHHATRQARLDDEALKKRLQNVYEKSFAQPAKNTKSTAEIKKLAEKTNEKLLNTTLSFLAENS